MKTIKNLTADKLRKSILQLAIQGKLVKQNPNDEPASELVKKIFEEKKKLIAEGKIKKDKNESYIFKGDDNCYYEKIGKNEPVKLEDLPFDIPDNWTWIRQKNICWLDNGEKSKGEKLPYLEAKVIRGLKEPSIETSGIVVDNSYRVILVDGENSGEIMTPPFRGYMGSTFKIFSATNKFNYELLLNIFLFNKDKYKNSKVGAAIPHLNKELFKESLIAVPPLEEQQRIVDKINSFEPLLQEYEGYEKKLTELESTFADKLKKSILQYAIEGKLVKQDPNDEPASVLLERIKAEKEKLIKEGKIKRDKNESYIYQGDDKNYYENLPLGWCETKLSNISSVITKGTTPRGGNVAYLDKGIGFLRAENIQGYDALSKNDMKYIDEDTHLNYLKRSILMENDILITIAGTLGRTGLVRKKDLPLNTNQAISIVRIIDKESIKLRYLTYFLNAPSIQINLTKQKKITAIPNLTLEIISDCVVPIAPINQQNKIINKLDYLFSLL